MQPSPNGRRVGTRIVTFEASSGFTHTTARWIAQPPKATFVTRLQPFRSPGRAARQLPDQSTTLRVESSSTGDPRLRGALPLGDIRFYTRPANWCNLTVEPPAGRADTPLITGGDCACGGQNPLCYCRLMDITVV